MEENKRENSTFNNENSEVENSVRKPIQKPNNTQMSTGSKVAIGLFGGCAVIFIGFIGIIFVLFFLGLGIMGDVEEGTNTSELVQEESESGLKGIGESLIVSDLKYTLLGYSVKDSVGEGFSKEEASEGSKLIVVELEVENIGSEEAYISASILNLIDKDNIKYAGSFHFGEDSLSLNSLQPQTKQTGTVLFEVPEITATEYLNLNIAKSSWVEEEIHQFAIDLRP